MAEPVVTVNGLAQRFGQAAACTALISRRPPEPSSGCSGATGKQTTAVHVLTTTLAPDRGIASVLGHDVVRHADTVRLNIGLAGLPAGSTPTSPGARTCGDRTPRADAVWRHRRPHERVARAFRPVGRGGSPGARLLRRDALPAGRSRVVGAPATRPVPGRTHHWARPARPQRAVGDDSRPGRRRDDGVADHAVPRIGRPAGESRRRERPWQGHRRKGTNRARGPVRRDRDRTWVRRPAGRRVACYEAVGPPRLQAMGRGISAAGGTMR
jgi:hypothetical protein